MEALRRRAPLLLAGSMTMLTILCAFYTFGSGSTGMGLPICTGITISGLLVSELLTRGLVSFPRTLLREIFGAVALMIVFLAILVTALFNVLPVKLKGWEVVVGATCCFTFLLSSQRSFLMHGALSAFLLLTSFLFQPMIGAAILYCGLFIALNAVLFRREIEEEVLQRKARPRGFYWAGPFPATAVVLTLLVLGFHFLNRDPGPSYAEVLKAERELPDLGGLEVRLPKKEQFNPVTPWQRPADLGAPAGEESGIAFERDLKFGDATERAGGLNHPETIVLYVQLRNRSTVIPGLEYPLFWKAGTVSMYDGREWTGDLASSHDFKDYDDGRRDGWVTMVGPAAYIEQRVIASPLNDRSLFLLYPVKAVELSGALLDGEGTFQRETANDGPFRYRALVNPVLLNDAILDRATISAKDPRYLEVPASFAADARVLEMTRETEKAGPGFHRRALSILRQLSSFSYTLSPHLPAGQDPTLAFLRARRGYCQHFASAMTLLLRQVGIPARIGMGFSRGDWDDTFNVWVVRRKHAHAWVEVLVDGLGWIPYDPAGRPVSDWVASSRTTVPEPTPSAEPASPAPVASAAPVVTPTAAPTRSATPTLTARPAPSPTFDPTPTAAPPKPTPTAKAEPAPKNDFDQLFAKIENRQAPPKPVASSPAAAPKPVGGGRLPDTPTSPWIAGVKSGAGRVIRDVLIIVGVLVAFALILRYIVPRLRRMRAAAPGESAGWSWIWKREGTKRETARVDTTPRGRVVAAYLWFLRRMAGLGIVRTPGTTAQEFYEQVDRRLRPAPASADRLTSLFEKARYGEGDPTEAEAGEADRMKN